METIALNKKKKKIMWGRVFIALLVLIILSSLTYLFFNYTIKYQYYAIDTYGAKEILGISADKYLIEQTTIETIDSLKQDKYQIVEYNYNHIINKNMIIVKRKQKDNKQKIQSAIASYMGITVYAIEIDIDGWGYILPDAKYRNIINEIKLKHKKLKIGTPKGVFVRIEEILDQAAIESLISNRKK